MSADDFTAIEDWAAGLLAALSAGERRKVNRQVAMELRRAQAARISSQQNPDGSAYAPRRPAKNLRGKRGHIRRKMFTSLRTARYLRTEASGDTAAVGYAGAVARIARVHQLGLRDRPAPNMQPIRYAVRQLLGFSNEDRQRILDAYARHLAERGL
ncbi:Mu-like prophage protein gpG [Bordetella ansorpii]|uniref:Mu-like prophage protein gpG n=1 Tax=Bordetella ansorpii TaxID=288768 RepID=A0A157QP48_9BORD|nr:phage virion morphogenesis protein [Bordetella ansorpii]SAI47450.1 Mu-like prophage protein gpG [Bordetella ansorpii]